MKASDSITKSYESELDKQCDPLTRKYVSQYFKQQFGITLVNGPLYGIDLQTEDGSFKVEVERKMVEWFDPTSEKQFRMLVRKKKFFDQGAHFALTDLDFTRIAIINNSTCRKYCVDDTLIEYKNSKVPNGELFYQIPMECVKFDTMVNDYKDKCRSLLLDIWEQIGHLGTGENNHTFSQTH